MRLLDAIDRALEAPEQRKERTAYWPSEASAWLPIAGEDGEPTDKLELVGPCMRTLYWKELGVRATNPTDATGRLKMMAGDRIEGIILDLAAGHLPIVRQLGVELDLGLKKPVRGRLDGLSIDPESGDLVVIEVKSTYGRGAKFVQRDGIKREWWLQTCLYVHGLATLYPKSKVGQVKYLVLARDNMYRTEIDKTPTPGAVTEVVERCAARWRELELYTGGALGEGSDEPASVPPPEYKALGTKGKWTHWRCSYCDYADLCRKREEE
jgi:hypothetical protein